MASKEGFFFPNKVGMFESMHAPEVFSRPIKAKIKMVQNGYELNYEDKEFIAKNLTEALGMIKKWMEDKEKEMSKGEEGSEHNSGHNSEHEG